MLYADSREASKHPDIIEQLEDSGIEVKRKKLISADWAIGKKIGIEKKTLKDLHNSLIKSATIGGQARLWSQLKKLSALYEHPILLVEGILSEPYSKDGYYMYKRIVAVETNILLRWKKIKIKETVSKKETIEFIKQVYNVHGNEGKGEEPPANFTEKSLSPERIRFIMLQSLKGIGPAKSKMILEHYPKFSLFSNVSAEEIKKEVKGINIKHAKTLKEVFQ